MSEQKRSVDKLSTQSWVLYLIIVFIAGAYTVTFLSDRARADHEASLRAQAKADLQCVAAFENASRARSALLTDLSSDRAKAQRAVNDSLHALTAASLNKVPVSPAEGRRLVVAANDALARFQKADDTYNRALTANPIPPPVFTCSDRLKTTAHASAAQPSPSSITYTAVTTSTAPGSRITATRTEVVTVPAPTTMTVPGPGATVTATTVRTATVTRTVAPPDCLNHPVPPCTLRVPTMPRVP